MADSSMMTASFLSHDEDQHGDDESDGGIVLDVAPHSGSLPGVADNMTRGGGDSGRRADGATTPWEIEEDDWNMNVRGAF